MSESHLDKYGHVTSSGRFIPTNPEPLGKMTPAEDHPWKEWMDMLRAYEAEHGNSDAPQSYSTPGGAKLGMWISNRRADYRKGRLSEDWVSQFESLTSWRWKFDIPTWDQYFAFLSAYTKKHGHLEIPNDSSPEGLDVQSWMSSQRIRYREGVLDQARAKKLEELPGWSWNPKLDRWMEKLIELNEFLEGNPGLDYRSAPYALQTWARTQIQAFHKEELSHSRRLLLESLPLWSWSAPLDKWGETFRLLKFYTAREGHAFVPADHVEATKELGRWVNRQRELFKMDLLPEERRQKLESIPGWVWDLEIRVEKSRPGLQSIDSDTEEVAPPFQLFLDEQTKLEVLQASTQTERIGILARWRASQGEEGITIAELAAVYNELGLEAPPRWDTALSNARHSVSNVGKGVYRLKEGRTIMDQKTVHTKANIKADPKRALDTEALRKKLATSGTKSAVKVLAVAVVNAHLSGQPSLNRSQIEALIKDLDMQSIGIGWNGRVEHLVQNAKKEVYGYLSTLEDGSYAASNAAATLAGEVMGADIVFGLSKEQTASSLPTPSKPRLDSSEDSLASPILPSTQPDPTLTSFEH